MLGYTGSLYPESADYMPEYDTGGSIFGSNDLLEGIGGIGQILVNWDLQKRAMKLDQQQQNPTVTGTPASTVPVTSWTNPNSSPLDLQKIALIVGIGAGVVALLKAFKVFK